MACTHGQYGGAPPPFVAPTPQYLCAAQPRVRGEFFRGSRLADTRLAHQRDETAPAPERVFQRGFQLVHLRLPADEHTACKRAQGVDFALHRLTLCRQVYRVQRIEHVLRTLGPL